jgi:hypothetical protein
VILVCANVLGDGDGDGDGDAVADALRPARAR